MQLNAREIVDIVSASGCLGTSDRQKNLLHYLLKKREAGQSHNIKAFNIAIDIMGRSENFDSSTDSIVRVEMHRLRKNLKQFNGMSKGFTLLLPASSFLVDVKETPQNPLTVLMKTHAKTLLVLAPLATIGMAMWLYSLQSQDMQTTTNCSRILPNVSVHHSGEGSELQAYVGNAIRSTMSQYTTLQMVENHLECRDSGTPGFALNYMALIQEDNTYRVALTTYHRRISDIVSFKNIGGVTAVPNDEDDLYSAIDRHLGDLAKPYGLIPNFSVTVKWDSETALQNYQCLITMYESFVTDSEDAYKHSVICLERSVKSGTAPLDNTGGLIASYIDQKHTRNPSVSDPMQSAKELIDKVGPHWVDSVEMVFAKISYETERADYNPERLKDMLNTAEAKYPSNPLVLLTSSYYTGFILGDWERALSLSNHAIRIHPEKDNSVYRVHAAYALLHNQSDNIMKTCILTYSENSLLSNLIVNACARTVQDSQWLITTDLNLAKQDLSTSQEKIDYIQGRKFDPIFTTRLVKAFQLPQP